MSWRVQSVSESYTGTTTESLSDVMNAAQANTTTLYNSLLSSGVLPQNMTWGEMFCKACIDSNDDIFYIAWQTITYITY